MLLTVLECWLVMQTITSKTLGLQPVLPRYKQGEKRGFPLFECCFEIIFFQATRLMFPPTSTPTTNKVKSAKFSSLDTVLRSSFSKPLARSLLNGQSSKGSEFYHDLIYYYPSLSKQYTVLNCWSQSQGKNRAGQINSLYSPPTAAADTLNSFDLCYKLHHLTFSFFV